MEWNGVSVHGQSRTAPDDSLLVALEEEGEPESDAEQRDPREEDGEGGLVVMVQVQGTTERNQQWTEHFPIKMPSPRHVT